MTAKIDGGIENIIIDRAFIDDKGVRWIIDYKTTEFVQDDLENLLEKEQRKYAE